MTKVAPAEQFAQAVDPVDPLNPLGRLDAIGMAVHSPNRPCELAQLGLTSSCPSTRAESKSGTEILPHTRVSMTIGT